MVREWLEARRGREALSVLLTGTGLLLTIALASYSPDDPSFFVAAPGRPANWIGPVGAQFAALLFALTGLAAWFLPLTFFAAATRLWRAARGKMRRSAVAGLIIVALSTAVLLALVAKTIDYRSAPMLAGGLIGFLISSGLNGALSEIGALVVAATSLVFGLVLTARSSLSETTTAAADKIRRVAPKPSRLRRFFAALKPRWPFKKRTPKPKTPAGTPRIRIQPTTPVPIPPSLARSPQRTPAGAPDAGVGDPDELGWEDEDDESSDDTPAPQPKRVPTRIAERPKQAKLPVDIPPAQAKLPPVELLASPPPHQPPDKQELLAVARQIESRCAEFGVNGQVLEIHPGPVVTTFEFRPDAGIKLARVTALADDLALGLEAETVRLDRIPGRPAVGIEVPNRRRETITLREVLESEAFRKPGDMLTIALGKTQEGEISVASLAKMPHLLVAGATGSGKSVGLNGIITSILYRARPDQVKFILIDPKMLELGLYEGIPHLLVPVVTDMKQAANALRWAVREMERRYRLLASCNTRHLDHFNKLVLQDATVVEKAIQTIHRQEGEKYEAKVLPYIVIVVDELADMLMTTGQETEEAIARLAQKARAVGIHLVLATQRPSVDVLTGSIKANFPARIAYRVASKIDSRTTLDASGAERLLGAGDMLYRQPGSARLQRVHGAYVSEEENLRVVTWLQGQAKAEYDKSILDDPPDPSTEGEAGETGDLAANDPMYRKAVRLVIATGQASTSFLQRRMRLGYSRAARIVDQMEQDGIVGPADGSRPRQILVDSEFLERMDQEDEEGPA